MSTKSYMVGFLFSVVITFAAFFLYELHVFTQHVFPTHSELRAAFIVLAILQLTVQLVCFLHVGQKESTQWNTVVIAFATFMVCVLVGGSLWIMANLDTNSAHTNTYLHNLVTPQNEDD